MAPGACFFTPEGTRIYSKILKVLKSLLFKKGFKEVITPNIAKTKLWKNDINWDHYGSCQYEFSIRNEIYGVKHANAHLDCLIYRHTWDQTNLHSLANTTRSWRDLPIKYVDFGILHKQDHTNKSNSLFTLNRIQRDDAHVFCSIDKIKDEINNFLNMLKVVYKIFHLDYELEICKNKADMNEHDTSLIHDFNSILLECIKDSKIDFVLKDEDLNVSKVRVLVKDDYSRKFYTGHLNVDFKTVKKFNLKYDSVSDTLNPVYINSSLLGSIEYFIGILTEKFQGKWPFWLSPRQVLIIPNDDKFRCYAGDIKNKLNEIDVNCKVEKTIPNIIDNSYLLPVESVFYNYIIALDSDINENIKIISTNESNFKSVPFQSFISEMNLNNTLYY